MYWIISIFVILCFAQTPTANSANLEDIYTHSLKNDPNFKVSYNAYRAGLEARRLARADMLPQITAIANHNVTENTTVGEFPITLDHDQNPITQEVRALRSVDNDKDDTSGKWGISLTQPIFNAPIWFNYKKGVFESQLAEFKYTQEQENLIYRVIQHYFEALNAHHISKLSEKLLKSETELVKTTERLFEKGLVSKIDVFQAQASLDTISAQLLKDQDNLNEKLNAISYISGLPINNLSELDSKADPIISLPFNKQDIMIKALKQNTAIRIAKQEAEIAYTNLEGARASQLPKLDLQLNYFKSNTSTSEVDNGLPFEFFSEGEDYTITLNASMPIYTGGRIDANKRQSRYLFHQAEEQFKATAEDIKFKTDLAYSKSVRSVEHYQAILKALNSNLQTLNATQKGYKIGNNTLSDVITATKNYYYSQRELHATVLTHILTVTELKLLTATLSPDDITGLNQLLTN